MAETAVAVRELLGVQENDAVQVVLGDQEAARLPEALAREALVQVGGPQDLLDLQAVQLDKELEVHPVERHHEAFEL